MRVPVTSAALRQNAAHDCAKDVGQAKVAAGIVISESLVIEPQEVQNCGVQVVNMDGVLDGIPA